MVLQKSNCQKFSCLKVEGPKRLYLKNNIIKHKETFIKKRSLVANKEELAKSFFILYLMA